MTDRGPVSSVQLKQFRAPLLVALIIGILIDAFSLGAVFEGAVSEGFGAVGVFGFSVISPLTVLLLILIFEIAEIKNRGLIVSTTALSFFLAMLFGFYQWIELRGNGTHMSGLLYVLGVIPSLLVGSLFGIYLARRLNKAQQD